MPAWLLRTYHNLYSVNNIKKTALHTRDCCLSINWAVWAAPRGKTREGSVVKVWVELDPSIVLLPFSVFQVKGIIAFAVNFESEYGETGNGLSWSDGGRKVWRRFWKPGILPCHLQSCLFVFCSEMKEQQMRARQNPLIIPVHVLCRWNCNFRANVKPPPPMK